VNKNGVGDKKNNDNEESKYKYKQISKRPIGRVHQKPVIDIIISKMLF